jgi:hypothetical protein
VDPQLLGQHDRGQHHHGGQVRHAHHHEQRHSDQQQPRQYARGGRRRAHPAADRGRRRSAAVRRAVVPQAADGQSGDGSGSLQLPLLLLKAGPAGGRLRRPSSAGRPLAVALGGSMDDEDRCPTCGRSGNEAPRSNRLRTEESILGRNLTWALGLLAVLYMLVKVFVVARSNPDVAKSVAGAVGVNSLVAGVMVAGLPDLSCTLLLISAAWISFDLIRERRPTSAVAISGMIFWAAGVLTAPRSQIGLAAMFAISLISLTFLASVFTSKFYTIQGLIRPLVAPLIVLLIISVPLTALHTLAVGNVTLAIVATISIILGAASISLAASRNSAVLGAYFRFLRTERAAILVSLVCFLLALGMALRLYRLNAFDTDPHIFGPGMVFHHYERRFLALFALLPCALIGSVLTLTTLKLKKMPPPKWVANQHRNIRFIGPLLMGSLVTLAVAMTAVAGLAEVIGGTPWLPTEIVCAKGSLRNIIMSEVPNINPPKTSTAADDNCLVGYILSDDGRWIKVLSNDERVVVSFPSEALVSRKQCDPGRDLYGIIRFNDFDTPSSVVSFGHSTPVHKALKCVQRRV